MSGVVKFLIKVVSTPFFLGVVISGLVAWMVGFYYASYRDPELVDQYPLLAEMERLHNQTIDFRLRQRGPRPGSPDVAILTIDESAIQKYGRWPWPRTQVAKVIDDIMDNGARSISFDIIFSEKQETILNSLESIKKKLVTQIPGQTQSIERVIENQKGIEDHDQNLTQVIEKHTENLVLGAVYDQLEYLPFPFQDSCSLNIARSNGIYDYWDKEAYLVGVQNEAEFNLPETWNKIVLAHFDQLQNEVGKKWLQENPSHPINKSLSDQNQAADALRLFALSKREEFEEKELQTIVPWARLKTWIPNKTRVDLRTQMKQELNDYCLRYLTDEDELKPSFEANFAQIQKEYEKFNGLTFEQASIYIRETTLANPVPHVGRWLFNIPSLQEATEHSGTFNATQDRDGSIRRAALFVRNGNLVIPSLAFKTYLVIKDLYPTANLIPNPYQNPPEANIVTNVELKNSDNEHVLTIPTDHRGQLPINYAGPQKMFSYLSAGEILDGDETLTIQQRVKNSKGEWIDENIDVDKKEYLKNKSFIFGATATGIYDLRVTPFEENYPGVETHANLLDNLIRQDYLKTSTQEEVIMPLAVFGLGLLFSLIVAKLGAISGLLITIFSLVSIYMVDAFFIFPKGTVITILFPIFTILFLYTFLTFFKYFTEERKKKQLKGTFQKYVSPEIVNEILKDPSKLELGGLKQEMTVFFSDIRGFTTISEKLDPKALSDLLNHYLTPMTDIIFKNSGTLDKYMGDAIMAFFGAPVTSPKHAAQACRSALQQIDKLFELQKVYKEQGLPMIDIGIGINTGDMSVGNMGSETVRNYTVMGDSVNLGSRLEGINKQYGTRIIISEFTCNQIKDDNFIYREIDWVKVKGKNEPVRIFELIGEGDGDKDLLKRVEFFNSGFQFYHEQKWQEAIDQFNSALGINADDMTSQLYIERCQNYLKEPPGEGWDGVFTMTTK